MLINMLSGAISIVDKHDMELLNKALRENVVFSPKLNEKYFNFNFLAVRRACR